MNVNKKLLSLLKMRSVGMFSIICYMLFSVACNKEVENILPNTSNTDTVGRGGGKKVLYIILDGVTGNAVRNLAPTTLTRIKSRSIFSYDGLADDKRNVITNAAGWANMLTGYDYTKHNVISEDFAGFDATVTPTIFARVKSQINSSRTFSVASTAIFSDKLATDASEKVTVADDAAVKEAVVKELGANNPTMVLAQFHSAEIAGATGGYDASVAGYATAIRNIDGYIDEMLKALQARPGFSGENWLVVIASNKGGAATSGGGPISNVFEDKSRNTFLAFYNPRFTPTEVVQPDPNSYPFIGSAPLIASTPTTTVTAIGTNPNVGNATGTTGELTVFVKLKCGKGAAHYYPEFLSKRATFTSGVPGWSLFLENNLYQLNIGKSGQGNIQLAGPNINDGKWHTIAFKIWNNGTTRTATLFTDGLKGGSLTIAPAMSPFETTSPIRLGSPIAGTTSANPITSNTIRDVAIYNAALTDDEILTNMRKDMSVAVPRVADLVGWWPLDESAGLVLADKSGNNNNMTLTSNATFTTYSELSPLIAGKITDAAFKSVANGIDIPVLIYNWLNIAVPQSWGLMGKLYQPTIPLPIN